MAAGCPGTPRRGGLAPDHHREQPCDYRDNGNERYYPVKTADRRYHAVYRHYRALADTGRTWRSSAAAALTSIWTWTR